MDWRACVRLEAGYPVLNSPTWVTLNGKGRCSLGIYSWYHWLRKNYCKKTSGLKVLTKYGTLTKINGLTEQSNDRMFTLLGNRSGLKSMWHHAVLTVSTWSNGLLWCNWTGELAKKIITRNKNIRCRKIPSPPSPLVGEKLRSLTQRRKRRSKFQERFISVQINPPN